MSGEEEWTVVFESPNNSTDFSTSHAETIADLLRFSLNMVQGVVSEMLSNVVER
jgi:hypothetical protein